MRSLLEISNFSKDELKKLLETIELYANDSKNYPQIKSPVASLFYEDSTRTRVSFQLAALNLGMKYVNIDVANSSENKGETLIDSINTLHAMGIKGFIIRHKSPKLIHQLHDAIPSASFINAGSGMYAHPTQTLLDLTTIRQRVDNMVNAKIVIVGDIKHSRVASSLVTGLTLLGVTNIVCVAPSYFKPENATWQVDWQSNLNEALVGADVVVALRVQKERFHPEMKISLADYQKEYRLDVRHFSLTNPGAFLMHPGPINRDVEITSALADSEKSAILQQVKNGVFARMAILTHLLAI